MTRGAEHVDVDGSQGSAVRIRILELLSERDHAVPDMLGHRRGTEVVYSVGVPEVRARLVTARAILSGLKTGQSELVAELTPSHTA